MKFKLKIGETELCHALMLAPLAGYTDAAFRIICAGQGAEYAVSEMISAKAVCYGDKKTLMIAAIPENSPPTAFQLFGCEPAFMASAAKELSSDAFAQKNGGRKPAAIDINMGCPVRKIVSNGEGSALMKNPSLAARIIEAVANAVTIPVTVKIRSGWDSEHINAPQIARLAQSAGASAVCVHPRTREQFYSGLADRSVIKAVKESVDIPVLGNGDIKNADDALRMISETGCDGIMIGRAAVGSPWIFAEIAAAFDNIPYAPPEPDEIAKLAIRHLELMRSQKGERGAFSEAKGHMAAYLKGMPGAAAARAAVNTCKSADEMIKIIEDYLV